MLLAMLQTPESLTESLPPSLPENIFALGGAALAALVVFGLLALFATRYKRCPANKILVVYEQCSAGRRARLVDVEQLCLLCALLCRWQVQLDACAAPRFA